MKLKIITSSLMLLCVISFLSATEWRIPVRFNPTSLDTYYHYTYYFGEREGATDNYDPFIDLAIPIQPPEGFFPYFVGDTVGDTVMPYLREDYRSVVDTGIGHVNYIWKLSFRDLPGESTWVIWDSDSFPYIPEYPLYMHFIVSETTPDSIDWLSATPITEQESVFIPVEQSVFFKYWDRTGIREFREVPDEITISVYPNPFNSSVSITVDGVGAYRNTPLQIKIYDLQGNLVYTMPVGANPRVRPDVMNGQKGQTQRSAPTSQSHTFIWQPDETISSGIYLVKASVDGETIVKRIIYLK